ncbi:sce7726 family protein [Pseudomonas sp. C1C7]|uniref:sce7726 family protein n=1 Tax=Pseudomonas sp. C1C7 TaxID=2735272 RepID=UPI001585DCFA|nr:sce7726 family protein [Pseudomonas sp. C1C7]NUT74142.1 sce7726 family protein [Pseudomonas sp. C1C7]
MREAEIKQALTQHLTCTTSAAPSQFLEELELNGGQIRADLVHLQDMHCYEIKSDADTLKRLIGQGSRYALVFDHITLVTAERHLKKAIPMLPTWWGIMVVPDSAEMAFKQVRKAKPNKRHEPGTLATLLKRDEALHLLEERGITRGFKSKSLYVIQAKIAELLPLDELKVQVRNYLMARAAIPTRATSIAPSAHTQCGDSSPL